MLLSINFIVFWNFSSKKWFFRLFQACFGGKIDKMYGNIWNARRLNRINISMIFSMIFSPSFVIFNQIVVMRNLGFPISMRLWWFHIFQWNSSVFCYRIPLKFVKIRNISIILFNLSLCIWKISIFYTIYVIHLWKLFSSLR